MPVQRRDSARRIVILGLLAALWAVAEIQLGFFFRAIKLPFFGVILTFCGFVILVISKQNVPRRGTILLVTFTTAFLKLIYLGALSIFPVMAIITTGILLEWVLWYSEQPGPIQLIVAGVVIFIWTFFYPFFALSIFSGWNFARIIQLLVGWSAVVPGISALPSKYLLLTILVLHGSIGILAASLSHVIFKILPRFIKANPVIL